jgi:hypothetical protein
MSRAPVSIATARFYGKLAAAPGMADGQYSLRSITKSDFIARVIRLAGFSRGRSGAGATVDAFSGVSGTA